MHTLIRRHTITMLLRTVIVPWCVAAAAAVGRASIVRISCEDPSPHLGLYGDKLAITPTLGRLASQSLLFLGLLACCSFTQTEAAADTRPNVLIIRDDEQERAEFNFLPEGRDARGKPRNLSPNIDRLAAEGVVFLNQYVSSPVCTPSRYSVLTGTYASRSPTFARAAQDGEQINITWNSHIDRETPNIARTLKKTGYFTGAIGKNHVIKIKSDNRGKEAPPDDADPSQPEVAAYYAAKQREQVEFFKACGCDFAASLYAGNLPGHTCKALEYHNVEWITSGALAFLDEWKQTDKPFFLYMATTLSHGPGPANRKYTGDPLATPAGLLKEPLAVQPPRASIPERVRKGNK